MTISYSFGIIDLLHIGHINVLREAKSHAGLHVFGLVEDEAAREWMGTLLSDYEERKRVLEQIACVDEIVSQKTFDPTENLRRLHEQYPEAEITLYHGNNWGVLPAEEYLRGIGGRVVLAQYYQKSPPRRTPSWLSGNGWPSAASSPSWWSPPESSPGTRRMSSEGSKRNTPDRRSWCEAPPPTRTACKAPTPGTTTVT